MRCDSQALQSHLETVAQAKTFLKHISHHAYQEVMTPQISSSAGAHMRHVIDHYLALKQGMESGEVDYNLRHRHSDVAKSTTAALQAWHEIETWLVEVYQQDMQNTLNVLAETSVETTYINQVSSTLGRELLFVSSHAVHHFSLLAIIVSLQGQTTHALFGVAPATATYQRAQA
ncbi:hypothetical protein [Paraglaciecola polaris]|uniref:DinB family protein n=1 Tax=Paraglaciecola polaris LMG 21857 TaxID=1129793 RepID=K6Z400_9ALTE|nr:hypothetical protein [Paraglaciecola polaris]GAC30946.1 hypothetical protein GPLA_0025 [Paraglaciecola polaris LMG 21857]